MPTSLARDLDKLRVWSTLPDGELGHLFSPAAAKRLQRIVAALLDENVFAPINRDNFPIVIRLLQAAHKEASIGLGRAIAQAGDHKDEGRINAFVAVMREFAACSPTRFHRDIAERYIAAAKSGDTR